MKHCFLIISLTISLLFNSCIGKIDKYKEIEKETQRETQIKDSIEFVNLIGKISGLKLDTSIKKYELLQNEEIGIQFIYLVKYKGDSSVYKKLCDTLGLINYNEFQTDSIVLNHKKYNPHAYKHFWNGDSLNINMKETLKIFYNNGEITWWNPHSLDSTNCLGYYYDMDSTYTYGYVDRFPKKIGKTPIYSFPMGRILCSLQNGYIYIFIDTSSDIW